MKNTLTVYHGSKNGLEGPIRMVAGRNRQTCDFGQGFYMGDEPTQPRTLICDGERPTLYTFSLDLGGLRVHRFRTDADWAMFVAYNRGFLENYRKTAYYRELKRIREENDVIFGRIANDRIFAAMKLFFDGLIGVPAFVKCLSVLNVGNQYCAISRKSLPPEHLFWAGYLYRYWHCLTGETSAAIQAIAPYRTMAGMYAGYHTLSCELAIENLREDAKAA